MNPFARFPFFRYTVPLIIGITIEIYFHLPVTYCVAALVINAGIIALISYSKKLRLKYGLRYYFASALQLFWVCLGSTLVSINDNTQKANYFENISDKKFLCVKLKEPLSRKKRSFKTIGTVYAVYNGNEMIATNGNLLIYFLEDSTFASALYCGDEIILPCTEHPVEGPKNPGEFDFSRYLAYQHIHQQIFIKHHQWLLIKKGASFEISQIIYRSRDWLLAILNRNIDTKTERGVAGALLFGYKDELDNDITDAYARTGTLHVLAVSGMHVAILYVVVSFLFKPFQKKKAGAWMVALFTIVLIWFYSLISGMSPSIVRASVMFTIIVVGKVLRDDISIYNNLFTSACLILCYDPYFLFDAGFQLSYLAVLGIVYFQPKIAPLLVFKSWAGRQVWSLVNVSLAAQIATVPISLYYFSQFPNLFLLSNLIIIPITTFIMYLGILLIVLCWIHPVAAVMGFAITKLIYFADYLIIKIQELPYAVTEHLFINKAETILWYLFILLLSIYFVNAKKGYLKTGLLIFCSLIAYKGIQKYQHANQYVAVLNSMKGAFCLNIIDGRKNFLFCDSAVSNTAQNIKTHFKGFWNYCNAAYPEIENNDPEYRSEQFIVKRQYLITPEQSVFFMDEKTILSYTEPVKINYLVLCRRCKIDIQEINRHFKYDMLIADGSMKKWRRNKYKEAAATLDIPFYDLEEKGAIILQ